jgi:MinD-like ATPase involved in chromosome partitioning or flagellar assembly
MTERVIVAADGAAWESTFVHAVEADDLGVSIVRRCIDVIELVSVAVSGQARVALVSSRLQGLDADIVDQILTAGVVPVAVLATSEQREIDEVRARGIRHVAGAHADPSVIASVVRDAAAEPDASIDRPRSYSLPGPPLSDGDAGSRTGSSGGTGSTDDTGDGDEQPVPPDPDGTVVAVWGPTGAPGRTTVAALLADEIARLGAQVLVVDADVYGGTLATRFGVLDESPGLAAACRAASTSGLEPADLAELCWQLTPRLRLLSGLPLAQRWPEIRPAALQSVLRVARRVAQWVVVDLGFCIEADEELAYDALTPRRNGATIAVLEDADVVLVVGACDPVGMQRLAYALLELEDAALAGDAQVVLNQVRAAFGAGSAEAEGAAVLERIASRAPVACIPYDREALDASLAAGRSLGELRQRGKLRQSVCRLAQDLTGLEARSRTRRHAAR